MPVSCCAINCTNRFSKDSGIGFYVFPADSERRKRWIHAISRDKWEPKSHDRVCGDHFVKGRPSKDANDIDYIPTIFKDRKRRSNPLKEDEARSLRVVKREKKKQESVDVNECAQTLLSLSASTSEPYSQQSVLVNESVMDENVILSKQVRDLQQQVIALHGKMFSVTTTPGTQYQTLLSLIEKDDNKTRFYTGLPSYGVFKALVIYFEPKIIRARQWQGKQTKEQDVSTVRKTKLDVTCELLAVLVRLRLGLLLEDIADRFDISVSTMSRIFATWLRLLSIELRQLFPWPSRELVLIHTPFQFSKYPNTRVIIDCTEIYVQRPSSLLSQSETFSSYKHHNTFKVLVGISPGGVITFVSELWGGRVSDRMITEKSGIIDLLERGDNVMADRGFNIEDLLDPKGVTLNIPPFLGQRKQLTSREVTETRRIAELRIHVERAIGRIKNYRLLQGVLPISLAGQASDIFSVCAYLSNFLPPVVRTS